MKRRRYPVPAGYPVPIEHIPDIPIDQYHLHAFGELSPLICQAMGVVVMGCGLCGEDVTLRLNRKPLGAEGVKGDVGSLIWGKDVAVICPCCSAHGCPHRPGNSQRAAAT